LFNFENIIIQIGWIFILLIAITLSENFHFLIWIYFRSLRSLLIWEISYMFSFIILLFSKFIPFRCVFILFFNPSTLFSKNFLWLRFFCSFVSRIPLTSFLITYVS